MRWDGTADAKLFMAVLKVHSLKLNYDAIAKLMGEDCTAKAISHRIAKLKTLSGEASGASASNSTPNTPTKTPKRKRNDAADLIAIKKEYVERGIDSDASSASDIYIDAVAAGSPKKKAKRLPKAKAPAIVLASTAASVSSAATTPATIYAPDMSFASTHEDPDGNSPQAGSLFSGSETASTLEEFFHSFQPMDNLAAMSFDLLS
ncbi:hypothetical protein Dda_3022 [Drechslerella dactyloides]|uniref:Uncharacterized protein n=1 Tax=Drechslerella dactyloides TaxID=74499 RepID=A0AAD6J1S7_DREDA|nr:hypothetical protein Dda_3022 [Drechslerella dactyloides]